MARIVLGLVGGIASGKSAVAALFRKARRSRLVDADAIAREVVDSPPVRREVARLFPEARAAGGFDRSLLARIVFSRPARLRQLEGVTHPAIRLEMERRIRRAREPLVLVDAPLLQETGADRLCDALVYVACPQAQRRARARRSRGWSAAEHAARERRQWPLRRKRAGARFLVRNGGTLAMARRDVGQILKTLDRGLTPEGRKR